MVTHIRLDVQTDRGAEGSWDMTFPARRCHQAGFPTCCPSNAGFATINCRTILSGGVGLGLYPNGTEKQWHRLLSLWDLLGLLTDSVHFKGSVIKAPEPAFLKNFWPQNLCLTVYAS